MLAISFRVKALYGSRRVTPSPQTICRNNATTAQAKREKGNKITCVLTAILGLSARTYSWGGDGGRLGDGGAGAAGFSAFLKYLVIPALRLTDSAMDSSAVETTEDKDEEESESDMAKPARRIEGWRRWCRWRRRRWSGFFGCWGSKKYLMEGSTPLEIR